MTIQKRSSQDATRNKERTEFLKEVRAIVHDTTFKPLNTRTPTMADRRVQAIFQLMLELDGLFKSLTAYKRANYENKWESYFGSEWDSPAGRFFRDSPVRADWLRFVEARDELNRLLSRYEAHPQFFFSPGSLDPWKMHLHVWNSEFESIKAIQAVASAGNLDRFRRCESCQDWFLARVDHQRCCSLACRQKLHRSSPEFKEQRRVYMQKLRRQHKDRVFVSNHPEKAKNARKAAKPKGR